MHNYDEQDKRILDILGKEFIPDVSQKTLEKYLQFIQKNIHLPCKLTGIEDFDWEEFYVFGPGSEKEYKELKKKHPSYTDTFELFEFDETDEDYGIMINAKRLSDNKRFILPLADLEALDKKSKNYRILDDYSVWFVNNR